VQSEDDHRYDMDLSTLTQDSVTRQENHILCSYPLSNSDVFHLEDTAKDSFHVVKHGGSTRYTHRPIVSDDRTACHLTLSMVLPTECYRFGKKVEETCGSYFGKDIFFSASSTEKVDDDGSSITVHRKFSHNLTLYRDANQKFVVQHGDDDDIYVHFGVVPHRVSMLEDEDGISYSVVNLWTGDSLNFAGEEDTNFCMLNNVLYYSKYDAKALSTKFFSYETDEVLCVLTGEITSCVTGVNFIMFLTKCERVGRKLWSLVSF
jgi:hypothetical protein